MLKHSSQIRNSRNCCHFFSVFLLIPVVVAVTFIYSTSAYAQFPEVEYLRSEIEAARKFAEKQRRSFEQWQARADEARQRAKDSKRRIDRESLLDDARMYDIRAESSALDADKAEAKSATLKAQLIQVLNILNEENLNQPINKPLPKSTNSNEIKDGVIPLEDTFGLWNIKEKNSDFVIVQENPESGTSAYKLEAHTSDRIWDGWYTSFEEGHAGRIQNARLVFKYKPKAEEMNPAIPEWARKRIQGQLEWEIELDESGSCGYQDLKGYLYPGNVKWNEEEKSVKIDGRGEKRQLELEKRVNTDLDLEMIGHPKLVVTMGGMHDPLQNPIEGLTKSAGV